MNQPARFSIHNRRLFLPLILFAFALGLPAFRSHAVSRSSAATRAVSSGGRAAMRVQIDPETGQLVPVTGTVGAVSPDSPLSHSVQGLEAELRAGGLKSLNLEGRFMESMVATTNASGRLQLGCLPAGQAGRLVRKSGRIASEPVRMTTSPVGAER